jgi:hypothetical protein
MASTYIARDTYRPRLQACSGDAAPTEKLSDRIQDDHIAWGGFSVRSAYMLAMELERDQEGLTGSSCSPDGSRSFYKDIWSAPVPQKV